MLGTGSKDDDGDRDDEVVASPKAVKFSPEPRRSALGCLFDIDPAAADAEEEDAVQVKLGQSGISALARGRWPEPGAT